MPNPLRAACCGFIDPDQPGCATLQDIPIDRNGKASVTAMTGGWGIVLMLVDHHVVLCKHIVTKEQDTAVTSQQGTSQSPAGTIHTGAVGWQQIVAATREGQLYESPLPDTQLPSDQNRQAEALAAPGFCWQPVAHLKLHVLGLSAGEQHSAALTQDGTVWTWGSNSSGQIGQPGVTDDSVNVPVAVAGPQACAEVSSRDTSLPQLRGLQEPMGAIACGVRHTCSVSQTGQAFCWGWNLHSQCGQGASAVMVDQPRLVRALGGLKVTDIAAGLGHTVACTDSGDVYAWGWNSEGQLGLGDDQSRSEPQLVDAPLLEDVHVDKVCCGTRHTVVKSMQGCAYAWGWNKHGQLGLGDRHNRSLPHPMPFNDSVADIECGWWHSIVTYTTDSRQQEPL